MERERADCDRAGAGEVDVVVDAYGGEHVLGLLRRDAGGDARCDEAAGVREPGEAVGRERIEQVVGGLGLARAGDEADGDGRGGHARVPVSSCTAPAVNVTRPTPAKPACSSSATRSRGPGRYAVDRGR